MERNSETVTTNPTVSEFRHEITSRLRKIAACVVTADNGDLLEELEELQNHIITLDSLTGVPEELFNLVSSARSILHEKLGRPAFHISKRGRPAFHISKQQLEMLLKARFIGPCIAELLYVSSRTVERRMKENRLSVRALYTEIQDCQLDDIERKAWLWVKNVNRVLVKWRFVVHCCVDGFTCLLGFLSYSTNNTVATVYSLFMKAVQEW